MTNEVNNVISYICDKIGCTMSDMLPEMYKYMVMKYLLLAIFLLLVGAAATIGTIRCYKYSKDAHDELFLEMAAWMLGVGAAVAFVISIITMYNLLEWLISSKAAMFDYIMRSLGGVE